MKQPDALSYILGGGFIVVMAGLFIRDMFTNIPIWRDERRYHRHLSEGNQGSPCLLLYLPPANLPPKYKEMLDPNIPLPSDVWFMPREIDLFGDGIIGIIVGGCFGLSGLLGMFLLPYQVMTGQALPIKTTGDFVVFAIAFGIMVLFTVIGYRFFRPFIYALQAKRDKKAGKLRQGLFVTSDAVLLCPRPNQCSLIPLSIIQEVNFKVLSFTKYTERRMTIVFPMQTGRMNSVTANQFDIENPRLAAEHLREVLDALNSR